MVWGSRALAVALLGLAHGVRVAESNCPAGGPKCAYCVPGGRSTGNNGHPESFWVDNAGTPSATCNYHAHNQYCPVTCEAGYAAQHTWTADDHLNGQSYGNLQNAFMCASDGNWHSQPDDQDPDCQPAEGWCFGQGGRGHPAASGVTIDDPDCPGTIGGTCSATCKPGTKPTGASTRHYTCSKGDDGQPKWMPVSGHELECVRVCPLDPEPWAGFRAGCTHDVGAQCDARCDPGYGSKTQHPSMKYTCGTDGEWTSDEKLDCQLFGCADAEPAGPNAEYCESDMPGTVCETKCKVGYRATGGSPFFNCTGDGEWKEDAAKGALECEPIPRFCEGNPVDESGYGHNIVMTDDLDDCDRAMGTTCTAHCAARTAQLPGTDLEYRCAADGTQTDHGKWAAVTRTPLICAKLCRLQAESHSGVPQHAEFTASCANAVLAPLASCVATCSEGYRQVGGIGDYNCDPRTGQWKSFATGEELLCARDCDAGHAPNSSDVTQCIECPPGLHSSGIECIDCQGGVWLAGKCQPKPASSIDEARDAFTKQDTFWQVSEIVALVAALVAVCCCWRRSGRHRLDEKQAGVLRASFLGGTEKLPVAKLTQLDVAARWAKAEEVYSPEEWGSVSSVGSYGSNSAVSVSSLSRSGNPARKSLARSVSGESAEPRRRRKDSGKIHVMFTNDHVGELKSTGDSTQWQERPLGQGSFGVVYKASWRGRDVAVKVLKLPERAENASDAANAALREQVEEIMKDFVTEIEVCCDLNHPNLVRLLGYADKPRLMIMQELLRGNSMDQQLYVERWKPTHEEVLKAAHDVARGMEYLHTMFLTEDSRHGQAIIHRDLKTPNLMLATRPTDGEEVVVKVTDFGLSRDKALDAAKSYTQTVMMTGCGSVLWMAPEILLGHTYNEKIDVFSYAMCLVELVDCRLPWSGAATGAEVPHKVMRGQRPRSQLAGTAERPVDTRLAQLIRDCWGQESSERPDFTTIILRLEEMMGIPVSCTSSRGSSNPGSARWVPRTGGGGSAGLSRPVSPEPEPEPETEAPVKRPGRVGFLGTSSGSSRSQTLLSGFLGLGNVGGRTSFGFCGLAILWFSLPVVPLVFLAIADAASFSVQSGNAHSLTVGCLVYCFVPCVAPLPIIKVVLQLLRQVRNEDDNLLLRRHSGANTNVVVETMRREHLAHTGCGGLVMFCFGVMNTVGQILLMIRLCHTEQYLLFAIVLSSSVSTVVTSLPLAFCILQEVARDKKVDFFNEVMERGHIKWVVLLSTSRIESLSVLRLRLCNCTPVWSFPMKPKHFYFMQSIGAYHLLVKDIPQVFVSLVEIGDDMVSAPGECSEGTWQVDCLLAYSPWFAIAFGSVNLAVTLLDGLIRAMAWATLRGRVDRSSHLSSSMWVRSGLSHRTAEFFQAGQDIPSHSVDFDDLREPLTPIGEEELEAEEDEEAAEGQNDDQQPVLTELPTATREYHDARLQELEEENRQLRQQIQQQEAPVEPEEGAAESARVGSGSGMTRPASPEASFGGRE